MTSRNRNTSSISGVSSELNVSLKHVKAWLNFWSRPPREDKADFFSIVKHFNSKSCLIKIVRKLSSKTLRRSRLAEYLIKKYGDRLPRYHY